MIDLNNYFYFVHVIEKGGFTAAANALAMPKSRLSRHIRQLEERLGVRLIQRTSRRFIVTEIGAEFYRHARSMLDDMAAAEAVVEKSKNVISGKIRLSCSVGMAQFTLQDIVSEFLIQNPNVEILQNVTNQVLDLLEHGLDMAVRAHTGPLPDSSLVQRKLAPVPCYLFAAPSYLERFGYPNTPSDLSQHVGLKVGWKPEQGLWSLRDDASVEATITYTPRLCSDDMVTLKRAAVDGLGILAFPAYICRDEVKAGQLQRVLPNWTTGDAQISLLMPSRRGVPLQVKAFSDYLKRELPRKVWF